LALESEQAGDGTGIEPADPAGSDSLFGTGKNKVLSGNSCINELEGAADGRTAEFHEQVLPEQQTAQNRGSFSPSRDGEYAAECGFGKTGFLGWVIEEDEPAGLGVVGRGRESGCFKAEGQLCSLDRSVGEAAD
jgi:hypothetical protein